MDSNDTDNGDTSSLLGTVMDGPVIDYTERGSTRNMVFILGFILLAGAAFFLHPLLQHKMEKVPPATPLSKMQTEPASPEALATIPGARRQEYEAQCMGQAMDKAKEMHVETNAFIALNRDYVNHCVLRLARASGMR